MTHAYSRDNSAKRGPRWLLLHCALCGDLLPRYRVELGTKAPPVCLCTEQLQRCRRQNREDAVKQAALDADRARRAPVTKPNWNDRDTQLGA